MTDQNGGDQDAGENHEEEGGQLENYPALNNSLLLVLREPGCYSFVKFVNSAAPSSRVELRMVYDVDPQDLSYSDSEEEEVEDEKADEMSEEEEPFPEESEDTAVLEEEDDEDDAVSYTHLTLPTIYPV